VNADGRYGVWAYEVTGRVGEIGGILERVTASQLQ
jgi:PDZ domain-containing secreted protein